MKIRNTYLLLVTIIGLVSLAMYTTYAMFTASVDVGEFVNLEASRLPTDTSVIEYERLTLDAGESKIIDLNITNSTDSSLYYGVWYEMIEPSTINNDIVVAKLDTSASATIGQLATNDSNIVTLILENNTTDSIVINIGVGYSKTSSLNLPTTRNIITEESSDVIDMSGASSVTPINFDYSGKAESYTAPTTGKYKLEVWGAQGGYRDVSGGSQGGKGGYSQGVINLNQGDTLYVYVGGQGSASAGESTTRSGAGFNANLSTVANSATAANYGGGGGGASDIRLDINKDGTGTLYERLIVAGGGGGRCGSATANYCAGGVGGGTSGGIGVYQTSTTNNTQYSGQGGSQTAGGARGTYTQYGVAQNGDFGYGGYGGVRSTSYQGSGAGGGGWYGGGGGAYRNAGGGGGSGFVLTSSTRTNVPTGYLITNSSYYLEDGASTIAGSSSFTSLSGTPETGHSGNGYARITPLSTIPSLTGLTEKTISPGTSYNLLSDVSCVDNGDGCTIVSVSITDTSTLADGEYTVYYIVKDNNNKKYKYSRRLLIISNLDTSGANSPDLVDGLIPVMYSGNKWVKADSTNSNATYKWYDYNNKQWANAVLVSSTNRQTYIDSDAGITISEDDVLAYYVWIPRYKYKVWNINKVIGTDSYNAQTTGIDIEFEPETETNGTIKCTSYSFASPTSTAPNETCSGSNGEYYTHPAFWWDNNGNGTRETNEEVRGLWVGKFEVSMTNNDKETNLNYKIKIKPNVSSHRSTASSSFSSEIQIMQASDNVYGLSTDKTIVDSHMLKNIEWGAVAYLTNSNYGMCSNNNCIEVASSSYYGNTGGGDYVTNIAQSTTGNVYGIYDMSGGAYEYVMANVSSSTGSFAYNASSGGINFTYSTDNAKYIDTYANGSANSTQIAYNRARLGDATGEVVVSSQYAWYNDYASFATTSKPWFARGTYASGQSTGVFLFYINDGSAQNLYSTRAALVSLK